MSCDVLRQLPAQLHTSSHEHHNEELVWHDTDVSVRHIVEQMHEVLIQNLLSQDVRVVSLDV